MLRALIRGCAGVLAIVGLLAACAPTNPAPTNPAPTGTNTVQPAKLSNGVIVSIRPITVSGAVHANVAVAFGGPMAGGIEGPPAAGAVEFIIREDAGDTISVVQANDDNFRPGERVGLTDGPHARIVRPGR